MASKKENLKALFSNTRTRIIIVFTLVLVLLTIVIGFWKWSSSSLTELSGSDILHAPQGIKSIPGAINQTQQYARLQQDQNIEQANQAAKKGMSAIPTIIRAQSFGNDVQSVGAGGGAGSLGFSTLARGDLGGPQKNLWLQSLKETHCSKDSVVLAMKQGAKLVDLKTACTCPQLKQAGYTVTQLKAICDCKALQAAGFSLTELSVTFSVDQLRACGMTACQARAAGFNPMQMKNAGFSVGELQGAGVVMPGTAVGVIMPSLKSANCSLASLREAHDSGVAVATIKSVLGCSTDALRAAGFSDPAGQQASASSPASTVNTSNSPPGAKGLSMPSIAAATPNSAQSDHAKQLQTMLNQQQANMAEQRYQQKIQARASMMLSAATQVLQGFKVVPAQQYIASSQKETLVKATTMTHPVLDLASRRVVVGEDEEVVAESAIIKTGDIVFAVIDTSVNSDEPSPVLATIVSGRLKGSKLIGTFILPNNADKMVLNFNTLSVPGAAGTVAISAYAIDPNTARTALSSETDHHYLSRYGSLFASTFLEGFGNAFQSANTTVTVGGTGGMTNTTISNGVGRSALENAVIGLATLGKSWGQVAQQNMNQPTTVQVFSGTGVGILFTQDLKTI